MQKSAIFTGNALSVLNAYLCATRKPLAARRHSKRFCISLVSEAHYCVDKFETLGAAQSQI